MIFHALKIEDEIVYDVCVFVNIVGVLFIVYPTNNSKSKISKSRVIFDFIIIFCSGDAYLQEKLISIEWV